MLGVTTVLQTLVHPSQQKLFDLLCMHCPPPSPVFFKSIHCSLADQLWYGGRPPPVIECIQCFSFIPVWNTSRGMGVIPPSNNTVTYDVLSHFC